MGIILKKQFAAIVGVWGAIANKMEAAQETCFFLAKITQASFQIIKRYVPKKKAFNTVIFEFFESLCRDIGKK